MKILFVLTCVVVFVAADSSMKKYASTQTPFDDGAIIKFAAKKSVPRAVLLAMGRMLNDITQIKNHFGLAIQKIDDYTDENSVFNDNVISNSQPVGATIVHNHSNAHQINSNPIVHSKVSQYSGPTVTTSSTLMPQPKIIPPVTFTEPSANIPDLPVSSAPTLTTTNIPLENDINIDPTLNLASFTHKAGGQAFISTYNIGSFHGLKIQSQNKILSQNNGISNSPGSNANDITVNNFKKGQSKTEI